MEQVRLIRRRVELLLSLGFAAEDEVIAERAQPLPSPAAVRTGIVRGRFRSDQRLREGVVRNPVTSLGTDG